MARDVTLQATMDELVGDETYELWLKHNTDAWELQDTGDVDIDIDSHQDFLLQSLVQGDDYVAQIRLKRAGRYRVGYITSNPDSWPSGSRCEFTPGALEGIDAPTIVSGAWARLDVDSTRITLTITPFDAAKDIKVLRDSVEVGIIEAPHLGDVTYQDDDPTLGVNHVYTAKHTVGFLDSDPSAPLNVFAGPPVPDSVSRTSPDDQYGHYQLAWDADSETVRGQDDFLCDTVYVDSIGGGPTTASTADIVIEGTETPPGGTQSVSFHARVRREVTSFSVTDVSDWVTVAVTMLIDDDNTDYHSCP